MSLPRLRAPADNGAVLAHPPLGDVPRLIERNRATLARDGLRLGGVPLSDLREQAITEALATAKDYLLEAGEPVPELSGNSLLLAGHQPELFHPGVWLKNFALSALARRYGSVPVNLVVDNDTAKTTTVRVPHLRPTGDPAAVRLASLPFDLFAGEVAYEEREVHDEALFADFPRHVAEFARDWPFAPLLPAFWEDVSRQRARTSLLGERFAAGRRAWERRWGSHNLDVPLSRLCRTEAFARFAVGLIERLPDFHATYNDCVRDYRRRHRIRSQNHPVPDLQREGDWLEAPFWAWRVGGRRRGRLFVRPIESGWELRAGEERWPDLPRWTAAACWRRLEADGFKVRTRALTTTLFARLLLADLFIHGIGGGKYDELNDAILARHFGVEPPGYLVLTGTLHLPLPGYPVTAEDLRREHREVRDLYWNPQRHLPADSDSRPEVESVLAERARLVTENPQEPAARFARFRTFRDLSDMLRPLVGREMSRAKWCEGRAAAAVAANAILRRRDYAFCLFPEEPLRAFCTQFTAPA